MPRMTTVYQNRGDERRQAAQVLKEKLAQESLADDAWRTAATEDFHEAVSCRVDLYVERYMRKFPGHVRCLVPLHANMFVSKQIMNEMRKYVPAKNASLKEKLKMREEEANDWKFAHILQIAKAYRNRSVSDNRDFQIEGY